MRKSLVVVVLTVACECRASSHTGVCLTWSHRLRPAEKSSTSLVAEEALSADEAGLAGMMCYACRTTFAPVLDTTSSSSESTMGIPLPTWVQPRMLRRKGEAGQGDQGAMTMESMKKVVDEYLIPDNA